MYDRVVPGAIVHWPEHLLDFYRLAMSQNPNQERYTPVPVVGIDRLEQRISEKQRSGLKAAEDATKGRICFVLSCLCFVETQG